MTTPRPRRRRPVAEKPAPGLPRPSTVARAASRSTHATTVTGEGTVHHVRRNYDYVRHDLVAIAGVTVVTLAFIVLARFVY